MSKMTAEDYERGRQLADEIIAQLANETPACAIATLAWAMGAMSILGDCGPNAGPDMARGIWGILMGARIALPGD